MITPRPMYAFCRPAITRTKATAERTQAICPKRLSDSYCVGALGAEAAALPPAEEPEAVPAPGVGLGAGVGAGPEDVVALVPDDESEPESEDDPVPESADELVEPDAPPV